MNIKPGDYVLATKYADGDPQDQWCVGFYAGITAEHYDPPRYDVADECGRLFRNNGFRKIRKITATRGTWLLHNAAKIQTSGHSLWEFVECEMEARP